MQTTIMDYVNRYERDLLSELGKRYMKYQDVFTSVLIERHEAAVQLSYYLKELGYE